MSPTEYDYNLIRFLELVADMLYTKLGHEKELRHTRVREDAFTNIFILDFGVVVRVKVGTNFTNFELLLPVLKVENRKKENITS